jgi:transposase
MSFKKTEPPFSFADITLFNSMNRNCEIKRMEKINSIVNWSRIESLLLRDYPVGKSPESNDAYHPFLLLKCLLLQQWFHIDSDPELETQINDRSSIKIILELPTDELAPDHSTFPDSEAACPKKL